MRRNVQALVLALVLLAGFVAGVASAPEAEAASRTCYTYCCADPPTNCATCCTGEICPDLNCH